MRGTRPQAPQGGWYAPGPMPCVNKREFFRSFLTAPRLPGGSLAVSGSDRLDATHLPYRCRLSSSGAIASGQMPTATRASLPLQRGLHGATVVRWPWSTDYFVSSRNGCIPVRGNCCKVDR